MGAAVGGGVGHVGICVAAATAAAGDGAASTAGGRQGLGFASVGLASWVGGVDLKGDASEEGGDAGGDVGGDVAATAAGAAGAAVTAHCGSWPYSATSPLSFPKR